MKKGVKRKSIDSEARNRQILLSLVKEFIIHRRPMGSKHLNAKYNLGVSPATIRNVLASLEKEGFLSHESHSSGRIPTARGLQCYIDSILMRGEIMNGAKISGLTLAEGVGEEMCMLEQACRLLSVHSNWVGLTCFTDEKSDFLDFDIKLIAPDKLLVFIICGNGEIRKSILRLTQELSPVALSFVKTCLVKESRGEKGAGMQNRLYSKNADTINAVRSELERLARNRQTQLMTSVHPSVLQRGSGVLDGIFSLIEEKRSLLECIESSLPENDSGITFCQSRLPANYNDLTVVISDFKINGKRYICGVLGSKYMDYMRVLPLVKGTAGEVAKYLTEAL